MLKPAHALCLLVCVAACGGSKTPSAPSSVSTTPTPPTSTPTPPPATSGPLTGTVSSSVGGARIAAATIRVVDGPDAGKSATSDTNGAYRFDSVQFGTRNLSATASGYSDVQRSVDHNGTNEANFTLTPTGPRTTFGAGTWRVGTDIRPERYFADPASGCYWERLSGFGGTLSEVISNDFVGFNAMQLIVDIQSSDRGFKSDAPCGTWSLSPPHGPQSSIRSGTWLVGSQLTPGTYATVNSPSGCYWERVRNFSGQVSAIIANEFKSSVGQALVTLSSSDVGFHTNEQCGTWTRVVTQVDGSLTPLQSEAEKQRNRDLNRRAHGR